MNINDQQQSIKYLLGELSEAEQSRLEERFFHDAELSELLSETEDDLIDRYVRQELSAPARERFGQHFLVSERRRDKLELARALLQAEKATKAPEIAAANVAQTQNPLSWWKAILSSLSAPRPALAYSLAAIALLFVLGGVWLFSEVRQLRQEVTQLEAERQLRAQQEEQLRQKAIEQGQKNDALAMQNEKLEQELALLKQQADIASNEPRVVPSVLAFILAPSSRSSAAPKSLTVPRSVQMVRLQLNLNAGDEYRSYRVRLQTAGGEQIRSWDRLSAGSVRGQRAVFVNVPASLLQAGQYELTLSGLAAPDRMDDLGFYYFRLLKE